MKVSYAWLCEWVPTGLSAAEAGERLTLAGLELDGLEPAAPPLHGVITGRIITAEPHPDADRLQVCRVDAGDGEPLQIVCGAPNARAGLSVALATVGSVLPGGLKIRKSKIRGVESCGMLCSGGELGLAETPGILELPDDLPSGQPIAEALSLDDEVLEIALTPNRGDCLSLRGIARELACLQETRPTPPPIEPVPATSDERREIRIEQAEDCQRYCGRIIRGLDRQAPSPLWLQERLRRAGLRSLNPLVDVTNYVMLELGQPMHAFDLAGLQGAIEVRRARPGESLTLLNEQAVTLDAGELVVADASGPIALAGAMGGLATSVTDHTRDVLLESACFTPTAVAGTGRRFKLSSESLHRFERGVDPELAPLALERATALLLAIAGGEAGPVCETVAQRWEPPQIVLRGERVRRLLGSALETAAMQAILERLECRVESRGEDLEVWPPSHRHDLRTEIDLVEEIARIHGYDRLPGRDRRVPVTLAAPPQDAHLRRIHRELTARGYREAVSFSFAEPALDSAFSGEDEASAIRLDNPISSSLAQMRRSLWASLLPVWQYNVQRQQPRVRLYEIGREYRRDSNAIHETDVVAGIASGLAVPEQWGAEKRDMDFYDLKADLDALPGLAAGEWRHRPDAAHPALHPGRCASLELDGRIVGHAGELHPRLRRAWDLPQRPLLFSVRLEALTDDGRREYRPIADTPSSRRDLAMLVDQTLAAENLTQYVKSVAGPELRSVRVFDVFTGDALPKGFKSVALGLIFQDFSRTLTDEEIDATMQRLISGLEREFGAQIRNSRGADEIRTG